MLNRNDIREHADIIGADGAHIGMVDRVEGDRIKLTKADSGGAGYGGGHESHHHYVPLSLVSGVDEEGTVRLSANGDVAITFEEEEGGGNISGGGGGAMAMADEEEDSGEEDLDEDELDDDEFDDDDLDEDDDAGGDTAERDDIRREFDEEHGDSGDGNYSDPASEQGIAPPRGGSSGASDAQNAQQVGARSSRTDGAAARPESGSEGGTPAFFTSTPGSDAGKGVAGGGGVPGSTAIESDGGDFAQQRKDGQRSGGF